VIRIASFILTALILIRIFKAIRLQWKLLNNKQTKNQSAENFSREDPYSILGVSKNTSSDELKKAYKNALKENHPDKVAGLSQKIQETAKIQTQKIVWAYETISKK
jgi:DnaJ-domain-containing protein 1